jgi:hypothetical protein
MHRVCQISKQSKYLLYTLNSYQSKLVSLNGYGKGSPTFQCRHNSGVVDKLFPPHHVFADRHIGPNKDEKQSMLEFLGVEVSFIIII